MMNGKWTTIPVYQQLKVLYNVSHSHINSRSYHARCQPADQEWLGVQSLAQGHFDTLSRGARDQTRNPMVARWPLYLLSHAAPKLPIVSCALLREYCFEKVVYQIELVHNEVNYLFTLK